MKNILITFALLIFGITTNAQKVTNGPELDNNRDMRMNRMMQGDDNSFYTYRIKSRGFGTAYYVEKYDKSTLKPLFTKEVDIEEDRYTFVENIKYAGGYVYIFIRQYDKEKEKMTLYYQSVSSEGIVNKGLEEILNVPTDHYEFVDFDIYNNPSNTKFMIKASYKGSKTDPYKTHFIFYDVNTMKKLSEKIVDKKLFSHETSFGIYGVFNLDNSDFIGLMVDDDDNIYFGYSYLSKNSTVKEEHYKLAINIFSATMDEPKTIEMNFDEDYYVSDVMFQKNKINNQLVVGGFLKDVIPRPGPDLVKVGIFSYTINLDDNSIKARVINMFDDNMLTALQSSARRSRYYKYKMDYMLTIDKNIYYVGEQYSEQQNYSYDPVSHMSRTYWQYEYMDVIVAKLNEKGEMEWITNTPLRISRTLDYAHVFKLYIATATKDNIYILNNENARNIQEYSRPDFRPSDLRYTSGIHGSNFVSTAVALTDGKLKHTLVFENEHYCFNPVQETNFNLMPPANTELFVKGKDNEIYIYTEDRGRDRFSKIEFE